MAAKINDLAKANETANLKSLIVFIADAQAKPAIEKLATDQCIAVPMVVPVDMDQALRLYKISPDAKVTIMLSKANKVLANYVNVTADTFGDVADAVKKALE